MKNKNNILSLSIWIFLIILAATWLYMMKLKPGPVPKVFSGKSSSANLANTPSAKKVALPIAELEEKVLPSQGVVLPVIWGDLGAKLVKSGVIDQDKFEALYRQRGVFSPEYKNLLLGSNNGKLTITKSNSGYLLNLFWALGLANENPILNTSEMTSSAHGGPQNLAAVGGWTIARGNAMNYYGRYKFLKLSTTQQARVDTVSRGIYRPCCGNSAHFPGCNHGMGMLGFLELMASQGVSEQNMWKAALTVNSYWFPSTYMTIATYMNNNGVDWSKVSPQEVLGRDYSSASGYARIAAQTVTPQQSGGDGSGCGVSAGGSAPAAAQAPVQQQQGCGI